MSNTTLSNEGVQEAKSEVLEGAAAFCAQLVSLWNDRVTKKEDKITSDEILQKLKENGI